MPPIIRGSTSMATPRGDLMEVVKEKPLEFEPIHQKVFGRLNVPKNKGTYGRMGQENWHEALAKTKRAPGQQYNQITGTVSEISYQCYDDGLWAAYDKNDRANYEDEFDYEASIIEKLRRQVLTVRELAAATLLFNETTWPATGTTGKVLANTWDSALGTPIDDFRFALECLWKRGANPQTAVAVMSWINFIALLNNPQIVGNKKYVVIPDQKVSQANIDAISAQLGIRTIIVGAVIKNQATEGVAVDLDGVWSKTYCWVGNVAQTQSASEYCVGHTYVNTNDGGDEVAESWWDEDIRSDKYRFRGVVGIQVDFSNCGFLMKTVHS